MGSACRRGSIANATARWRSTSRATARRRPTLGADQLRVVRRARCSRRARSASRCAATRSAAAWRCTSRSPRPSASRAWCWSRPARASRTTPSARARRAADRRLADELESDSVRGLHRALAHAAAVRRRAGRGRRAGARGSAPQRPARARVLRGVGTGEMASLWGRLGELEDAGDGGRRRARREVPRDCAAHGGAVGESRRCEAVGRRARPAAGEPACCG